MAVSAQVETLNRVRYGGLDFDTHFDDLRARTQVQFAEDFNDFALSSLGIMLLDIVAYGLDSLSFYLDRRATDAYLDTARTRKAVARLSRQLGYKMGAAVSSSVDVEVAINTPVAFSVPVPKGFQFKGPEDLVYETADVVTFDPFSGPTDIKSLPCYEGQTLTENFVSTGQTNQSFELRRVPPNKFVVQGAVQVIVNGADWTESDFISFDKTDQFEVGYNDDPPTVRFGDGTAGNIPEAGAPIVVIYVAARGKAGQIAAGAIEEPVSPLVVSFTTIDLTVTNPLAPEGGDDPEAIAKVRTLAGRVFKSRQVAVTRGDYQALSSAFADPLYGRVAASQAISSRSAAQDTFLQNTISDLKNLIAPVKDAVNFLTKYNASPLTGTVSFANASTAIGGVNTKFLTEVQVGQYIKKTADVDALFAPVLSIISDTSLTLGSPYQGTSGTAAAVLTGPTGVVLLGVLSNLSDLQLLLAAVASNNNDINTLVSTALTTARNIKNNVVEISSDAANIITEATAGATDVTSASTATANLIIGAGAAQVLYVAKVAGVVGASVTVTHVPGGALSVAVVNLAITVTVAPTSTATQVAAAVIASAPASALVNAYAFGAGNATATQTFATTNLAYSGVTTLGVSGLPDTLQSTLQRRLDRCNAEASSIQTTSTTIQSDLDNSIVVPLLDVAEKLVESGTDVVTPGSQLYDVEQERLALVTAVGTDAPTGLYQTFANIDAEVVPLATTLVVGPPDTVGSKLLDIFNHVDVLLSDDCKSNLVSVPILTHDAAGFYTEPSLGLQQALQSYLDARKEVTQTVKVTSGKGYLVRPVLVIRAGVKLGYSLSVTETAISSAVDGILRDRDFGVSLYLSDFCQVIDTQVAGLAFLNVDIRGYNDKDGQFVTDKLDTEGNLIIDASEVITKEQRFSDPSPQVGVSISTEIVTPT